MPSIIVSLAAFFSRSVVFAIISEIEAVSYKITVNTVDLGRFNTKNKMVIN